MKRTLVLAVALFSTDLPAFAEEKKPKFGELMFDAKKILGTKEPVAKRKAPAEEKEVIARQPFSSQNLAIAIMLDPDNDWPTMEDDDLTVYGLGISATAMIYPQNITWPVTPPSGAPTTATTQKK